MNLILSFKVSHVLTYIICIVVLSTIAHVQENTSDSEEEPIDDGAPKYKLFKTDSDEELFKKLFIKRRQQHEEAIKRLKEIDNYERSYKMIALLIQKIVEVIESNKTLVEILEFTSSNNTIPQNDSVQDALSTIWENTAFFGDIALHFSDIVHRILKSQKEWSKTIQWSLKFANQMKHFLDKSTVNIINLARQELNMIKREPGYLNPYQFGSINHKKNNHMSKNKDRKKEKKKKVPQMVKIEL